MRVTLTPRARAEYEAVAGDVDKAQVLGLLRRLGERYDEVPKFETDEYSGGRYAFAGNGDGWKVTFHKVELDESVVSVISIKPRRTVKWALRFFPKKDSE